MTVTRLHIVGLGCARNDVDSEELAARLAAAGFKLVAEPDQAEVVLVNTCGFIDQAKKDSIDQLLAATDLKETGPVRAVIATGCLAERYGVDLAEALPEVDAVIGFDGYNQIGASLRQVLSGQTVPAHQPRDRRLLPLVAVERPMTAVERPVVAVERPMTAVERPTGGPASRPTRLRHRLTNSPSAPLKIASGCDRRCAFCAIPFFQGGFVSRPADAIEAEARWLAGQGVKELYLVSENTTAYGKDLADPSTLTGALPSALPSALTGALPSALPSTLPSTLTGALPALLRRLSGVEGIEWIRLSYLQPAELHPELIVAMAETAKVVPYFDLSFQHAAPALLRRMRRFRGADSFLDLIDRIRQIRPDAGLRSNVIVGFPGETAADLETLSDFLAAAQLDAIGVFGYSDEEGTEGQLLDGHLDDNEISARVETVAGLAEVLMAERARRWIGGLVDVLIEEPCDDRWRGRTPQQGPEADGETIVESSSLLAQGQMVRVLVRDSVGVDLIGKLEWPGERTPTTVAITHPDQGQPSEPNLIPGQEGGQ